MSYNEVTTDVKKTELKKRIIEYSANVKNFAKWFEIPEVKQVEEKYTVYKVVYRFLPKDLNDTIKEITAWKRFRDFNDLNFHMNDYHVSLHRRDKFPEFPRPKFFNRFDQETIELRRQASLKLLQFIGSQSHLYKHEKFIEFLVDGRFNEHATLENENKLLQPKRFSSTEKIFSQVELIQGMANDLDKLIKKLDTLNSSFFENAILFLSKSLRYINTAIQNEASNDHFASFKLLKSAANNLENFLNDEEQSYILDINTDTGLRILVNQLKTNSENIEKANFLDSESPTTQLTPSSAVGFNTQESTNSNIANDWILSDFNLSSHDFSSQLTFISGNLFDLNFCYQLCRVLNTNCMLMKERKNKNEESNKYILKSLRKSSKPNLNIRTQVPISCVPYMCRLIKYFETDDTIFLLLEYHPHGKLFQYLKNLTDDGLIFLDHLNKKSDKNEKKNQLNRRKSLQIKLNSSFTNFETVTKRRSKSFRYNNNIEAKTIDLQNFRQALKVNTDVQVDIKIGSSSSSSSDSLSKKTPITGTIENKHHKLASSDSSSSNSDSPIVLITSKLAAKQRFSPLIFLSNSFKSTNKISKSETQDILCAPDCSDLLERDFVKQTRKWLAQLFTALKNLHEMNIICKDIRPDNLLLTNSGDLVVTYFSKWNLVDEKLNKEGISCNYTAPELCGLVNYPVSEACDWWSFGVIAYEMLTMNKFSDINPWNQLYVNNLNFPSEFKDVTAKDLIKKLVCLNPNKRLTVEKIKSHAYFRNIDWNVAL